MVWGVNVNCMEIGGFSFSKINYGQTSGRQPETTPIIIAVILKLMVK